MDSTNWRRSHQIKSHGIHYTPPDLARFLAESIVEYLPKEPPSSLTILDPACGDGALLIALHRALPSRVRNNAKILGFETDREAIEKAREMLRDAGAKHVALSSEDFLDISGTDRHRSLFDDTECLPAADIVIANPPYVRTQVLGSKKAQQLARRFGLTGRVDLYHAFTMAMANSLKPGGVLGLLTSNRFLTIKSGASLRRLLSTRFELNRIVDLGDTKLFATAAVLPVIVVASARQTGNLSSDACRFERVYEHRNGANGPTFSQHCDFVLDAVSDANLTGLVKTRNGNFLIERGTLALGSRDDVWTLSTPESRQWIDVVKTKTHCVFADLAHVRVGIKTTADDVYLHDWKSLDADFLPEEELLRPLLTHHDAGRWRSQLSSDQKRVLYPHTTRDGKRRPIVLDAFPRAQRFLVKHKNRLSQRTYVLDAGREWFEIWVPHNPADWAKPKIVYPDISEFPRFFLDKSGSIVNGDCYWITLRAGVDEDWLLLMLAVANSSFITRFYDTMFHNKLYSGRRRFMTQYVREFPIPFREIGPSRRLLQLMQRLIDQSSPASTLEEEQIDRLVWEAFGLVKEA